MQPLAWRRSAVAHRTPASALVGAAPDSSSPQHTHQEHRSEQGGLTRASGGSRSGRCAPQARAPRAKQLPQARPPHTPQLAPPARMPGPQQRAAPATAAAARRMRVRRRRVRRGAPATADASGASAQLCLLQGDGCAQVARANSAVTPATAPCAAPWAGGSTCAVAWHARPASDLRVHQLLAGCLARPMKTGSTAHAVRDVLRVPRSSRKQRRGPLAGSRVRACKAAAEQAPQRARRGDAAAPAARRAPVVRGCCVHQRFRSHTPHAAADATAGQRHDTARAAEVRADEMLLECVQAWRGQSLRSEQQRRNDKAWGARALACGVTPRLPATETNAGPVRSPRAAAWCRRLRAARCSSSAVHARSVVAAARWALLEGGGLVHAPQPAAAGPGRARRQARGGRREGAARSAARTAAAPHDKARRCQWVARGDPGWRRVRGYAP